MLAAGDCGKAGRGRPRPAIRPCSPAAGTQVVKVFDLVAARTGLRDAQAVEGGHQPLTVTSRADDHKAYYPGATPIAMRWTGDRRTGRLLGIQLVGRRTAEIAKRVEVAAAALFAGLTVEQVSDVDPVLHPAAGQPLGRPASRRPGVDPHRPTPYERLTWEGPATGVAAPGPPAAAPAPASGLGSRSGAGGRCGVGTKVPATAVLRSLPAHAERADGVDMNSSTVVEATPADLSGLDAAADATALLAVAAEPVRWRLLAAFADTSHCVCDLQPVGGGRAEPALLPPAGVARGGAGHRHPARSLDRLRAGRRRAGAPARRAARCGTRAGTVFSGCG